MLQLMDGGLLYSYQHTLLIIGSAPKCFRTSITFSAFRFAASIRGVIPLCKLRLRNLLVVMKLCAHTVHVCIYILCTQTDVSDQLVV